MRHFKPMEHSAPAWDESGLKQIWIDANARKILMPLQRANRLLSRKIHKINIYGLVSEDDHALFSYSFLVAI